MFEKYINKVTCGDCLEVMKELPDNCVDMIVTDPPYGIKWRGTGFKKKNILERNLKTLQNWDVRLDKGYFNEIKRISKEWIIWGGNYYAEYLGNSTYVLVWNKLTGNNVFTDGELAFTSFKTHSMRIFTHQWCGAFKDSERGEVSLHPTQKPLVLMKWIINQFTNKDDIICDPFLGSGTTAVACKELGRRFIGIEINPDYCKIAEQRLKQEILPLITSE